MPSTVIFTLSPAASYTTVLILVAPGLNFDLASLSFQVPMFRSAAIHRAKPARNTTREARIVFVFMSLPLSVARRP
jgi:hypothetical protein